MRQAWIIALAATIAACGPDLGTNEAFRCDEELACNAGSFCYRGFCVPDSIEGMVPEPIDVDPAADAASGVVLDPDSVNPVFDAGILDDASSEPPSSEPPPSEPPSDETPAAPGAPAPVAPAPVAPAPAAPAPAAPAPPAPATPVTPEVSVPGSCTLKACCAEAKKAAEDAEDDDDEDTDKKPKKGKCGCNDPDLLQILTCGLGSLVGL